MKFLLNQLHIKILALLASIVLWIFVVGIENNSYRFPEDIDVQVINIAEDLSLTNLPGKAKLRLRASQNIIKQLSKSDFDVTLNVQNLKEGDHKIKPEAISKNDKVTILKIDPGFMNITLEKVNSKEVPLKIMISGTPQKGYSLKAVNLEREIVTVTGAESVLQEIKEASVQIVLYGRESANYKQNFTIQAGAFKNIKITPEQVIGEVLIVPELQQKTVIIKPKIQGDLDISTVTKKLQIDPLTVVIQGKEDMVNKVSYVETEPISIETLKNSKNPVKAKLVLPEDIILLSEEESIVQISLVSGS